MEPDQNELVELHSPRQAYELTHELEHADGNHFDFHEHDNPFSYYHPDDKRDNSSASEDEAELPANTHTPTNPTSTAPSTLASPAVPPFQPHSPYPPVQPGENLSSKPPLPLTPLQSKPQPPAASIKLLKEAEIDLSKLKVPVLGSPLKAPLGEEIYRKEMQDDMQDLKNSLKGKEAKKKSKIFEADRGEKEKAEKGKINLNKTYAPVPRGKGQNELQVEQMRMLVKMSFEKKKANYSMLREWDGKRAESLALHGRMIQLLQNEVDLRIKSSLQNLQHYQTFFREKAKQEEKYVTSPVINTRYALQNNSLSKNVYINCSVILNSLCDQNTARCRKIADFIHLIRHAILKELTEAHLNASQKQLLKVREKISTLKASLKKYNAETEEKSAELALLFNEQASNIAHRLEKDFYRTQLSFLRKAAQQVEVQKKLGEYCLEYYHVAIQEELKRSQVIREAMVTYSKGLKQAYNLELECAEMEQLSKHEEVALIQQFYSLDEIFDARTLQLFRLKAALPPDSDITLSAFTRYIAHFHYDLFDSRVILLKEFNVKYIGKSGEETCYLTITVDNFLHLFLGGSRAQYGKPDITVKIGAKWLQTRVGKEEFVDIVKKEEKRNSMMSYFWDNKVEKVYRVRFSKKDSREEFMDYITKLMLDHY